MNWEEKKFSNLEGNLNDSACEHVEAGAKRYCLYRELDSFGTIGEHMVCRDCFILIEEESGAELKMCQDCHELKPSRETIAWEWYDFYAPQGDEALIICDVCVDGQKHRNRVAQDEREYNIEMTWKH